MSICAAFVSAMFATGPPPVAAQVVDPEACAIVKSMREYVVENPDHASADLIPEYDEVIRIACGEQPTDTDPRPNPARQDPPATVSSPPQPTPRPTATPDKDPESSDMDACKLLTPADVGAVIGGAAHAFSPDSFPGASGCDFRTDGDDSPTGRRSDQPYLEVIYAQASGNDVYTGLRATAEQNTDSPPQSVSGLGEKAFTYTGRNGPGILVLKANKVVILEFGYTNPGATAFLTLARQATARVH